MMENILRAGFEELGLKISDGALSGYRTYFEYLEERSAVMNLTAISGEENVARLHFLDCAALLGAADFGGKRVIDIGSGAGFPGLVLRIAEPAMDLTLLDSLSKRVDFLTETCKKLGFEDVKCLHARAEELPPDFRGAFDIAVSRAVARLDLLCELCLPYVRVGGLFIAMKGPDCAQECSEAENAMTLLGARTKSAESYRVPGTDVTHRVVVIEKIAPTPTKYPRKWAQIKKKPL